MPSDVDKVVQCLRLGLCSAYEQIHLVFVKTCFAVTYYSRSQLCSLQAAGSPLEVTLFRACLQWIPSGLGNRQYAALVAAKCFNAVQAVSASHSACLKYCTALSIN